MAGHGEKRSRREEVAIAALLSESTLEKAAAKAKVSERTLRSWLKRPDFLAAWREARRAVLEDAVAVMQKLAMGAAIALGENLKSANPNAKNAAALGLIDRAFRGVDVFELTERVEALEAAEAARKRKQRHQ